MAKLTSQYCEYNEVVYDPCITFLARWRLREPLTISNMERRGVRSIKVPEKVRVTCPVCKRRMIAKKSLCHDGCCISYLVPKHKPKFWWKKKTK